MDTVMEEPNHLDPLEQLWTEVRQHAKDDNKRFQDIGNVLEEIRKHAASSSRWSKAGAVLGAAIGGMLAGSGIVDRIAHHFPWLLDALRSWQ